MSSDSEVKERATDGSPPDNPRGAQGHFTREARSEDAYAYDWNHIASHRPMDLDEVGGVFVNECRARKENCN
jgi:hypothetical protein